MQPSETTENALRGLIGEWLNEAVTSGLGESRPGEHRHIRYGWAAPLDVYGPAGRRPGKAALATARDVSRSGVAFFCRERVPLYTRITVCRAGCRSGLPARILNRTQTLGGYIYGVEFTSEEQRAGVMAVA